MITLGEQTTTFNVDLTVKQLFSQVLRVNAFPLSSKPIRHVVAQAHWVGSKPIRNCQLTSLHKPTMAIGYSLRMCARHVNSTNSVT